MVQMIENTWEKLLIVAYFVPVMVIGMVGNIWVIFSVARILHRSWSPMNGVFKHMAMYILSLSIADMFVLCMVPMLISYFLTGSWEFGYFGCKVFFAVENVNKLLSVAILSILSFERFLAVCRPFHWFCCRRKQVSNVLVVLIVLFIAIVLCCVPMIFYAETSTVVFMHTNGSVEFATTTCGSNLPDDMMSFFIGYMFVLGFVLPAIFISLCYFLLIRRIRKNNGRHSVVTSYTTRVVRSIMRVVLFHFACWTPFWLFVLLPMLSYFGMVEFDFLDTDLSQTIRMVSSFLPYLNSAGNWIFYAAMNRELRDNVVSKRSRVISSFNLRSFKRSSSEFNKLIGRNGIGAVSAAIGASVGSAKSSRKTSKVESRKKSTSNSSKSSTPKYRGVAPMVIVTRAETPESDRRNSFSLF
ncbi:Protein NPR-27 [Aphelenchoides avenae]|nr:Protein NPR-27 [Aphelenchus avenae]